MFERPGHLRNLQTPSRQDFQGNPLGTCNPEFSGGNVSKRGMDIVVAATLLILFFPVLMVCALLIRVTSPGPILFRQRRAGRGFRSFEILKLRTMAHAQPGHRFTLGADSRITPIGRWLRRTKIDELPQLWNVLRGEMSLVGPRPVLPELAEEFGEHYAVLLQVRPGLTDPASLKYSQEAELLSRDHNPMEFFKSVVTPDKINISKRYLSQANPWSDLCLVAMTAFVCCVPALGRSFGELPEPRYLAPLTFWPTSASQGPRRAPQVVYASSESTGSAGRAA